MSGIGAVYNLDGKPADLSAVYGMLRLLAHRGPDEKGVWFRRDVALVHCLHRTTPESRLERLPCEREHNILTCDARLDNRDELAPLLGLKADAPDSEFILAAYEKWGVEMPSRLVGDFVFAIWDAREQRLFAARDPLGVKHFYYFHDPLRVFALASEIKALFAVEGIPREIDEQGFGDFLVLNSEDKEQTMFRASNACQRRIRSSRRVTAGSTSVATGRRGPANSGSATTANTRKPFARSSRAPSLIDSAATEPSDRCCPAGSTLRRSSASRPSIPAAPTLETFSAVFPRVAKVDGRIDETAFIRSVVGKTECRAHFVDVDGADPLAHLDETIASTDHPVGAPNVYMDRELYAAARKAGVRVLLSGTDGDSTVSHGYDDFSEFVRRGWYWRHFRESLALSRNMPRRTHTFKRNFWHRGVVKALPESAFAAWRTVRGRPAPAPSSPVIFPLNFNAVRPELRERLRLEERFSELRRASYPAGASAAENHWCGLTSGHYANMLEQLEKISARFGVEPRYPFFDRRLVEFCIALPPGQRIAGGWTRAIFRRAMEGVLPPDVQWRTDKSNIARPSRSTFSNTAPRASTMRSATPTARSRHGSTRRHSSRRATATAATRSPASMKRCCCSPPSTPSAGSNFPALPSRARWRRRRRRRRRQRQRRQPAKRLRVRLRNRTVRIQPRRCRALKKPT